MKIIKKSYLEEKPIFNNESVKWIIAFRGFFVVLSLVSIVASLIDGTKNPTWATGNWSADFWGGFAYFTMQTNIFILCWWVAALLWRNNAEKLTAISGKLRGALCLYISVTFLIFSLILERDYIPVTSAAVFTNITLHYILPLAFLVDWFLTEKVKYSWKFLFVWFIYPVSYLIFSIIYSHFTGIYIYYFLEFEIFPLWQAALIILSLMIFFIVVGSAIIFLSRYTRGSNLIISDNFGTQ